MCNGQTSTKVHTRYRSVTMANEYVSAYLGHVSPHPSRTTRSTADKVTDYPWRTRLVDARQTQLAVIVATPRIALAIESGKIVGGNDIRRSAIADSIFPRYHHGTFLFARILSDQSLRMSPLIGVLVPLTEIAWQPSYEYTFDADEPGSEQPAVYYCSNIYITDIS